MTDGERAENGLSREERLALFEANTGLVGRVLSRYYPKPRFGAERDDYRSLGLLGLWKATGSFDESRGVAFSTHAFWKMRGEISTGLRAYGHHELAKLNGRWNHKSFEAALGETLRSASDAGLAGVESDRGVDLREAAREVNRAVGRLPDDQLEVVRRWMGGESMADIARCAGLSRQRISQVFALAKDSMRARLSARGAA